MADSQTRIFVPWTELPDHWAETVMGRVVQPLVSEYADRLEWFWFSRYVSSDGEDCDINKISGNCKQQRGQPPVEWHRTLRFRFSIAEEQAPAFETSLRALLAQFSYEISDVRQYDTIGDTGNDRFLGDENRQQGRRANRSRLVIKLYQTISELMLDSLVAMPDGRFRKELNTHPENPGGSTFVSLFHLFSNITWVPLPVIVYQNAQHIAFGTHWQPPPTPPAGAWTRTSMTVLQY